MYLDNRSRINISCVEEVVQHAENHCTPKHQATVIHCSRCWMVHGRPQAEEKDNDKVDDSEAICHYTKYPRNTPRAPREFLTRKIGEYVCRARVELDVTA